VDIDKAPEIVFTEGLAPSGEPLAVPPRVRWRQRAVGQSRAAPSGAPAAPRTPVALPQAARPADPNATGRRVTQPDTLCDPPPIGEAGAQPGGHREGPPRPAPASQTERAGEAGPIDATDIPHGTGRLPHGGEVVLTEEAVGNGNLTDGTDPAQHANLPLEALPGPEGPSHLEADDAAVAVSADPQRAPRDIELWLIARRAQGAALRLDFELRTAPARQVFRRDFVYVSRQLHALEGSRRVQGLDRARLNEALATLRQRADAVQAFMEQRAAELQALIAAGGPASAHIAFARPARFQATIVSPGAHRFLTLLMKADETLAVLETAWLLGLVEPATRAVLASDCRRALLGFKDLACDLRRAVGLLVQDIHAQRREAPGAARDD